MPTERTSIQESSPAETHVSINKSYKKQPTLYLQGFYSHSSLSNFLARMVDAFSQPGSLVSLLLQLASQTETKSAKMEGYPAIPMFILGPLIGKRPFQDWALQCGSNLPFSGHIVNTFRRSTILQLNIEGLTASKMNVLDHLAVQHEALVILFFHTKKKKKVSKKPFTVTCNKLAFKNSSQ